LQYVNFSSEPQDVKKSGFTSLHIPKFLPPMDLSPTELKLFAGHSLQLLKSKCPTVSPDKLSQLNKYISKLISKTNPVPKKSEQFTGLANSINTCAKEEKQIDTSSSYMDTFVSLMESIFGSSSSPDNEEQTPPDVDDDQVIYPGNSGLVVTFNPYEDFTSGGPDQVWPAYSHF